MSEVLYRKYRPQTFAEVVGQDAITRTLKNSVAGKKLAHAYLFCGPRGTGKTSLGRLLAKAANCAAPTEGEPCNTCDSCRAFIEGRAIDFVEQDAASHNSVDDIRQLRENVALTPMSGELKVYLLDEVHMLSKGAYNALLKTLEEPPPHIIFVLATTEPHKVEATIISRCQRFDLKRISSAGITKRLAQICEAEGFTLDQASLDEIARSASGSARDAINGLEQVVTYYGAAPTSDQVQEALGLTIDARSGQLAALALNGDLPGGLKLIATVRDDGVDMRQFAKQVVHYLRGLLLAGVGASDSLDLPAEMAAEVKAEAKTRERGQVVAALRTFGRLDTAFRDDPQSSLPLELA
ncbi:MAG TPA: DNA polymerase III subunit gamma/tau, partial [Dehalococcoidia bacterium]|nr:DNA polymerase III subunit gamma/tau [Dehalococcoidia bacterium]